MDFQEQVDTEAYHRGFLIGYQAGFRDGLRNQSSSDFSQLSTVPIEALGLSTRVFTACIFQDAGSLRMCFDFRNRIFIKCETSVKKLPPKLLIHSLYWDFRAVNGIFFYKKA